MKKLLEFFRQNSLFVVRPQDIINIPRPFCRELMPHERKSVVQKKPQKGYKKPFMKRIYHK